MAVSFSCPHYEFADGSCNLLKKPCVPGRPGCVLRANSDFVVPVEERLADEPRATSPPSRDLPDRARRRSGPF